MTRMSGTMVRCSRAACAGSTRVGGVEAVRPASLDGGAGFEAVGAAQAGAWGRGEPAAGRSARHGSLLEVLGGIVDVLAGLLEGALTDRLVLIGGAIDL